MSEGAEKIIEFKPHEDVVPVHSISKKRKWLAGGILIFAFALAGALTSYWYFYLETRITTEDAFVEANIYPVNSRIMGYVKEVYVEENDSVEKAQHLAAIDDTDYNVELALKQLRYEKAQKDLNRARELQKSNAISKLDLENAIAAEEGSRVDLDATLLKLKYTNIDSITDGVIAKKSLEPGQFVQPGQILFMIVPNNKVWIKANFKETQLENIKPNLPVEVHIDAYPNQVWKGKVEGIFPSSTSKTSLLPPDNASGNFTRVVQRIPVKISIESKAEFPLRPGMSATAVILTQ